MRRTAAALVISLAMLFIVVSHAQSNLAQITGTVRDATGAPRVGVEVTLWRDGVRVNRTRTDRAGAFSFPRLTAGGYEVTAEETGIGRARAVVNVAAGAAETVTLRLASPADAADRPHASPPAPPPAPAEPTQAQTVDRLESGVTGGVVGGLLGGISQGSFEAMRRQYESGAGVGRPPFNTETYDKIDDNQWTDVTRKPLSTFSIDVDTASYSNVRRFLNQGQLPPKDAVRIEELINYFSYEYPEPKNGAPFAVTTAIGASPWHPRRRLALIGLQGRRLDARAMPPRNLVFLVDVSGSMNTPQKLPLVKASLSMLARNLTARDRIAIVVYAGAAGLVLPSTSGADTSTILEALGRLHAGGSTNGAQGLELAYNVARQRLVKGGVNRVVLATDGDFNVGITNRGALVRLIEENRESGVALSVLGFGMGNLKDSTLEQLADKGNGNYAYIDTLQEAQKVLVEQAGGTLVTVAKDVKLQVEFNPRTVAAYRLVGYENRSLRDRDFNDDTKDAGELGAGHSVTAMYEIVPAGEPFDLPGMDPLKYQTPGELSAAATSAEAMTVKLRYKLPEASESTLMSVAVAARTAPLTPQLGFAAAVAQFGMLLRDSEHKGLSSYAQARSLAERHKGADPHGHRADFIRLIGMAESVAGVHTQW